MLLLDVVSGWVVLRSIGWLVADLIISFLSVSARSIRFDMMGFLGVLAGS